MITVKKATLDDLAEILKVEEDGFPPAESASTETLAYRINNFGDFVRIALIGGQVVGYYCARPIKTVVDTGFNDDIYKTNDYPEGDTLALQSIVTLKEFQGQGVGKLMIYQMIDLAAQKGMRRIILACLDELIPYYEKFGFTVLGTSQSTHGNHSWNDMELYLEDAYLAGSCSSCHNFEF